MISIFLLWNFQNVKNHQNKHYSRSVAIVIYRIILLGPYSITLVSSDHFYRSEFYALANDHDHVWYLQKSLSWSLPNCWGFLELFQPLNLWIALWFSITIHQHACIQFSGKITRFDCLNVDLELKRSICCIVNIFIVLRISNTTVVDPVPQTGFMVESKRISFKLPYYYIYSIMMRAKLRT